MFFSDVVGSNKGIRILQCLSAALISGIVSPLQAANESAEQLDSTVTYPAAYFEQYDPVSARDMLNRIPGIDLALGGGGGGGRGLGAGGDQILIDGRRVAGKENGGRETLGRIAAKQVDYIEIIRGTSSELNVRSAGPIVNVVLREGAARSSISAEINMDFYQQDHSSQPGGSLAFGGETGAWNYLASIEAEPRYQYEIRNELSVLGDGSFNDRRREDRFREQTRYRFSGNLGYRFDNGDRLQLNGLAEVEDPENTQERDIFRFNPAPDVPQHELELEERDTEDRKWEFGGNYAHSFSNSSAFNLIFIVNEDTDYYTENRFNVTDRENIEKDFYSDSRNRTRERIVRTSYTTALAPEQDVEIGVEAAQTTLDTAFLFGLPPSNTNPGPASPSFGGLVPSEKSTASTIEEMRYEPFVIHNWQLNDKMALESTLVYELSEIDQVGVSGITDPTPIRKNRDFRFWRPKVDYRYDITPATQLRATIERDVSQLNFRDFSSSGSGDPEENVNSGNPDLVQEKSWKYELNFEYRFADDAGVINTRVFYHDLEDVIATVDITPVPEPGEDESLNSAPGNIGDGKRYGMQLDTSLRLGFLGAPNALVTTGLFVQDSEIDDPFLMKTRRINGQGRGRAELGFRHDIPAWNLNYGFDYEHFLDDGPVRVDIDDIRRFDREGEANVFIEKVAFNGITFRFEGRNLLNSVRCLERTRYVGRTSAGIVEEVEDSCIGPGRKYAIKIRTTF